MNICANCKHSHKLDAEECAPFAPIQFCNAPQNVSGIDVIDGRPIYLAPTCREQREQRFFGRGKYCGPEGDWYEPKIALQLAIDADEIRRRYESECI